MSNEEEMTIDERWKYLRKMKRRYVKAGRKEQGRLLDEMEAVTGMHRKSLIRRMNSDLVRQARSREREKTYGPEVDDALRVIYESFDCICADRLTPNLVWMTSHLARHGELEATPTLLDQLAQISISTVERVIGCLLPARACRSDPSRPRNRSGACDQRCGGRSGWCGCGHGP